MVRRLTAILAADVVGYSRLIRANEDRALAAFNEIRTDVIDPKITENRGRIFKLVGDGILAEFGSVVDAIHSAVDIQRTVTKHQADIPEDSRIVFRIGINLGEVVIDGDDIQGDGVNVAVRLEARAEPGSICLSGKVYEEVRDRTDLTFEDMGEQELKNIDRPVRAWRWANDIAPGANRPEPLAKVLSLPGKPSIAVLPFDNMSSDAEQEYFADGITEDIITELSRFNGLFVIARNSSFTYKGRAVKVQDIRGELGVRYVVEGSVRKSGDRVRVTVQLIDSETGNHLWAERYDRRMVDIFDIQDELTRSIVATLPGRIVEAETERHKRLRPQDMAVLDFLMAGRIHHHRVTKEDNAEAMRLLQKAIDLDPTFAESYAWKACTAGQALQFGFRDDPKALEKEAVAAITRALSLDENNVECHRLLCEVYMHRHDVAQAAIHGARAFAMNPNDPRLVAQQGELMTWMGRAEEGVEWIRKAMRLDPMGTVGRSHLLGRALYGAKHYGEALEANRQIASPHYTHRAVMLACLGQLNMGGEAEKQAVRLLEQKPDFTIGAFVASLAFTNQADRDHMAAGLRKTRLPE